MSLQLHRGCRPQACLGHQNYYEKVVPELLAVNSYEEETARRTSCRRSEAFKASQALQGPATGGVLLIITASGACLRQAGAHNRIKEVGPSGLQDRPHPPKIMKSADAVEACP